MSYIMASNSRRCFCTMRWEMKMSSIGIGRSKKHGRLKRNWNDRNNWRRKRKVEVKERRKRLSPSFSMRRRQRRGVKASEL